MLDISFCTITTPERKDNLLKLAESISGQVGLGNYEMRVALDSNHEGLLGKLRNEACKGAQYQILCVVDDDITLDPDFSNGLISFGMDWDVLCVRVLNPDGSRYWDWREYYGFGCQEMVDYSVPDSGKITPPGCCVLLKREVFEAVKWDESIPFYTPPFEDVEFGLALHAAGYTVKMNTLSTVHHNDDRYSQSGNIVVKR